MVKVSIESLKSNNQILYDIDVNKSFEEIIDDICEKFEEEYSPSVYGLKLLSTNDGRTRHSYISSHNFNEIKDGYFLKLVFSVSYYIKRIFDHITDNYKERSFQDLYALSFDSEFINEMVRCGKHQVIVDLFTNNTALSVFEKKACLIAIVHLFQKKQIDEISDSFLNNVVLLLKEQTDMELVKYTLSLIKKILNHRNTNFDKWKEEAIRRITVKDLMRLIRDSHELQFLTLSVINSLIKWCKGEKRQQLIKEIDARSNREAIFEHVISNQEVDRPTAHELYVYQTYLLSLLSEALTSVVADTQQILQDEFGTLDCEMRKMTVLMDFDEASMKNKAPSVENILEYDDIRISLASISSKYSEDSRYSSRIASTATSDSLDLEHFQPSLLTIEALRHYKKMHYKNFSQSVIEEEAYQIGILPASEKIVRVLGKILHIGQEPDRVNICYQPSIFTCSSKTPFFFELFSRTMWLLSKTRREMKACTIADFDKVIHVLEKQVKLVLVEKPFDLKKLTECFSKINYEIVQKKWQEEKENELKLVLEQNPSVQILKGDFREENEIVLYQQRLNFVKKGTLFPKFFEKKINGNFFARISNNERHLLVNDRNVQTGYNGEITAYPLTDITHIIEGKACPHVKNNAVKEPRLAFSILFNNTTYVNFKAADMKTASYWVDALNLLMDKESRSSYYENEMDELLEMDLVLHLIELQNVTIPKKPPPIPPPPFETKPILPPKPQNINRKT